MIFLIISHQFFWEYPTHFFSNYICVTSQLRTHVYTKLIFIKILYQIWNIEVPYFELPMSLSSLYIVPCHIFLIVLPFSSISLSVMMFYPFGMVPKIFSRIHFLYVQTCYMHNILHVSYFFYCVNGFVTKHIARKTISLKVFGSWWYFYVMVLNHSTSASRCNMPKIMTYKTFKIIHLRK